MEDALYVQTGGVMLCCPLVFTGGIHRDGRSCAEQVCGSVNPRGGVVNRLLSRVSHIASIYKYIRRVKPSETNGIVSVDATDALYNCK